MARLAADAAGTFSALGIHVARPAHQRRAGGGACGWQIHPMAPFALEGAVAPQSKIYVFGEGMCVAGRRMDEVLEERGGDLNRFVRVGSHEATKGMAEGGLGESRACCG